MQPSNSITRMSVLYGTVPSPLAHLLIDYRNMRQAQIRQSYADSYNTHAKFICSYNSSQVCHLSFLCTLMSRRPGFHLRNFTWYKLYLERLEVKFQNSKYFEEFQTLNSTLQNSKYGVDPSVNVQIGGMQGGEQWNQQQRDGLQNDCNLPPEQEANAFIRDIITERLVESKISEHRPTVYTLPKNTTLEPQQKLESIVDISRMQVRSTVHAVVP